MPSNEPASNSFASRRSRPRWWVVAVLIALHCAALYGFAKLLAPGATASIEREILSTFTVTITAPPDPPPSENPTSPDEGAAGDRGERSVPKPESAASPLIEIEPDQPLPPTSSTGQASQAGAADDGDATGAIAAGTGTGSGREGQGAGDGLSRRPEHISGTISNARDYPIPEGGRDTRRGTQVIVRVTVGVDGRARGCTIYRPSPDPEADAITCQLVEQRLRFRPALDAQGNPVPAPFYWRQRWF